MGLNNSQLSDFPLLSCLMSLFARVQNHSSSPLLLMAMTKPLLVSMLYLNPKLLQVLNLNTAYHEHKIKTLFLHLGGMLLKLVNSWCLIFFLIHIWSNTPYLCAQDMTLPSTSVNGEHPADFDTLLLKLTFLAFLGYFPTVGCSA